MNHVSSFYLPTSRLRSVSLPDAIGANAAHSGSSKSWTGYNVDVNLVERSLQHVNNFSKRNLDKLPQVFVYEINSMGESCYKTISLRALLQYVNEVAKISATSLEFTAQSKGTFTSYNQKSEMGKSFAGNVFLSEERKGKGEVGAESGSSEFDSIGELRLRDLRRLDFQFNPNEERSVLIRRHSVLFAMDPLRAVVMADRLILIVPDGADSLLSILNKYMNEWVVARHVDGNLRETNLPPALARDVYLDHRRINVEHAPRSSFGDVCTEGTSVLNFTDVDAKRSHFSTVANPLQPTHAYPNYGTSLQTSTHRRTVTLDNFKKETGLGSPCGDLDGDEDRQSYSDSAGTPLLKDFDTHNPLTLSSHSSGGLSSIQHQLPELCKAMSAASDLPFEVHAYEALLTTVMVLETQEFNRVNAQVQVILGYFRSGSLLPIEVQEQMRNRKNDLCSMLNRIRSTRNTIHQLTEDDEDMALMNLSLLKEKPHLYRYPLTPTILARHDEIEELLESYLIDMNALESKIEYARSQIQNAEELLSLRLDISRNELLIADTLLAMLACCFGLGAYVGGIFGMNLDNTGELQETKGGFYIVTAVTTIALCLFFLAMLYVLKRNGTFPKRMVLREEDAAKLR